MEAEAIEPGSEGCESSHGFFVAGVDVEMGAAGADRDMGVVSEAVDGPFESLCGVDRSSARFLSSDHEVFLSTPWGVQTVAGNR
jgi:hypothetical protein